MKLPYKIGNALILSVILMIGLGLRLYNLAFPSIGYHNMQENEYMGIAHEMDRTHDYLTKRIYSSDAVNQGSIVKVDAQPPLVSYQTLIAWKLLGENLWGPRLINVIFGVLGILAIYFVSGLLFTQKPLSLFVALSFAIMPLNVFFSRNLQPESPALFFMLLGSFFYLRFISIGKRYNLILSGLAFSAAWLYKFSFLVGVFPFLLCLPLAAKRKKGDSIRYYALAFLLPYAVIAAAAFFLYRSGQFSLSDLVFKKPPGLGLLAYLKDCFRAMWAYMRYENFAPIFMAASILGILGACLKRGGLVERYIMGWTIVAAAYFMLLPGVVAQNSYSQMPFLALVCISSAYAALFASRIIMGAIKKDLLIVILIAIIASSIPFAREAIIRMHSTVYAGLDVAGESLRDFTKPDERFFLLTHPQGYGIARYARRYATWTFDPEEFKLQEKKFNIHYICAYPQDFIRNLKDRSPDLYNYIQDNYHIKEAGMTEEPQQLYYLILEKGRSPDPAKSLETITGSAELKTIYRVMSRYIFFYTIRPPQIPGAENR